MDKHGVVPTEEASVSVNEIMRGYGASYLETHETTAHQRRVMQDLRDCRSGALGGQIKQCDSCGEVHYHNHSCRNRHCPQCGGAARSEWLMHRGEELLPVPYFHVVFTIDHVWNPLLVRNQAVCYDLPYEATEDEITPVTVHSTTHQQVNFRLKTGRFVNE